MFPPELESNAYRVGNGEFGWTREQIPRVVDILRSRGFAILGGELWWVRDEIPDCWDLIPLRNGGRAVYPWETKRQSGEPWPHFVERCANDTIAATEQWPTPEELPLNMHGRILCNLTWVSEVEYEKLGSGSGVGARRKADQLRGERSTWWKVSTWFGTQLRQEQKSKIPLLADTLPPLSQELGRLLEEKGQLKLAHQVPGLRIVDRCRCGDDFCASFYTQPKPPGAYGPGHFSLELEPNEGMLILDIVDGVIAHVEILNRDDIRQKLLAVFP
jgi:hypothetical protein